MIPDFLKTVVPREDDGWYEFHLHHHAELNPQLRRNHFHSMKHSQGVQAGRKLRLVIDDDDEMLPDIRVPRKKFAIENYVLPGYKDIEPLMDEIVIRRDGQEVVVLSRLGVASGFVRLASGGSPTGRLNVPGPETQQIPIHTPEGDAIKRAALRSRILFDEE